MMRQEQLFPATLMPDQDWWRALWPDPDKVIGALLIEPGMAVVDLGCGDGYFTAAIARRIASARVIGFDLDPAMLAQAQVACAEMSNCDWLIGDAMQLHQLITTPVDYVLIANTFHGVPEKTALTWEIAAVLRPGGSPGDSKLASFIARSNLCIRSATRAAHRAAAICGANSGGG